MKRKEKVVIIIEVLVLLLMIILMSLNLTNTIDDIGISIAKFFRKYKLNNFFLIVTNTMRFTEITIILLLTYFLLRKKGAKKDVLIYAITVISTSSINYLIKSILRRARPINPIIEITGYSFSSGHSATSMVVYGFLILLTNKYSNTKLRYILISIFIIMIILTGLSRLYFGVHYLSDILSGFILGLIILNIANIFLKKLTNH